MEVERVTVRVYLPGSWQDIKHVTYASFATDGCLILVVQPPGESRPTELRYQKNQYIGEIVLTEDRKKD